MAGEEETPNSNRKSCLDWFRSPSFFIYANYLCSQWGDWMWLFASGLYLVHLDNGRLMLAAIFGFAGGGCVLLFGGLIGEWVDRNHRLYVVRVTLLLQNSSVMLSAITVGVALHLEADRPQLWQGALRTLLEGAIVTFAILAQLASIGYKISIEKDWIVVVARGNKATLANLNAVTRALDLTAKILAPTCVGLVMSYMSLLASAILIAAWNLVSVCLEYCMIMVVYRLEPQLAIKKLRTGAPGLADEGEEMTEIQSCTAAEKQPINEMESQQNGVVPHSEPTGTDAEKQPLRTDAEKQPLHTDAEKQPLRTDAEKQPLHTDAAVGDSGPEDAGEGVREKQRCSACRGCLATMFGPVVLLVRGWKTYARQRVVFAGLALATLYMTVMGFDSVTVGYIYSSGATEWVVGVSMALAGLTGIISTFVFTVLRRRVGLERTGLIAFNLEILCLTLAVASVWAPGSPFDVHFASRSTNCSQAITNVTQPASHKIQAGILSMQEKGGVQEARDNSTRYRRSLHHLPLLELAVYDQPAKVSSSRVRRQAQDGAGDLNSRVRRETRDSRVRREARDTLETSGDDSTGQAAVVDISVECAAEEQPVVNISIILFLLGIITSRTGLWLADLVVTQLLQENVKETERGVVNGVQNSLNMLMEMTKFVLVLVLPHIETFGILILLSFAFICLAGMSFATHSYRVRGHLFHFEKCLCNNNFGTRGGDGAAERAENHGGCVEPQCGGKPPAPVDV